MFVVYQQRTIALRLTAPIRSSPHGDGWFRTEESRIGSCCRPEFGAYPIRCVSAALFCLVNNLVDNSHVCFDKLIVLTGVRVPTIHMTPIFQDRNSRRLFICAFIFIIAAISLPTHDRFALDIGGHKELIIRHDKPLIYWGTELVFLFVAIALSAYAIYRNRRK
jgi:hypothetical protein